MLQRVFALRMQLPCRAALAHLTRTLPLSRSGREHLRGDGGLGVRDAEVPARLSAIASSRRIRPATASLVIGGSDSAPSSSSEACLCSSRSRPACSRCSGASSARISSARCTRAPAATAARAERRRFASSKLASRLAVARTSRRMRRSSQASTDSCAPMRVSSAPIASPSRTTTRSLPRTSRALADDAEPAADADERQRGLGGRAGDLERAGAAGLGERAVREERAAPGGLGVVRCRRRRRGAAGPSPGGRAGRPARSGGPGPRRPWRPGRGSGCPCAGRRRRRSAPRSRGRRSRRSPCAAGARPSRCRARPR